MFHKNYEKKEKKDKIKEIIIKVNPLTNNRAIKVQEGKRKITKREKQSKKTSINRCFSFFLYKK